MSGNAYRATRRAAGCCAYCGTPGATPCLPCRERRNEWHRQWRARRRAVADLAEAVTATVYL